MPIASKTIGQRFASRFPVSTYPPTPTAGKLFSWGYNRNGELGIGAASNYGGAYYSRYSPVQVGALTTWTTAYVGYCECFARHSDGSLWAWGRNALGQLGVSDTVPRSSPTQVTPPATWNLRVTSGSDAGSAGLVSGKAYNWGQIFDPILHGVYIHSPTRIGARTDWQDLMAQEQFFMGIIGGKLYGWGNNDHYQLGLGYLSPLSPNISLPVQAGAGTVWFKLNRGWGPVTSALDASRRLWIWGNTSSGQSGTAQSGYGSPLPVPTLVSTNKTWRQVATGYKHVLGIDSNGYLWVWGGNAHGQLGTGNTTYLSSPTQLGALKWTMIATGKDHSLGITTDGKLWAWGMNNYGKLGLGDHGIPNTNPGLNSRSLPVQVGTLATWTWCAANKYNSFGIRT